MTTTDTREALWSKYHQGQDRQAREALVLQYAHLVHYATRGVITPLVAVFDAEDAASQGTLGLMQAIERFEPQRGIKFESYATYRIRGSVIDALRSLDGESRGVRQRRRGIAEARAGLQQELGREPTKAEVARRAKVNAEEYGQILQEMSRTVHSLDEVISSSEDGQPLRIADVLEDPSTPDPVQVVEEQEDREELRGALEHLTGRERLVISLYYFSDRTLREIGESLHVSESRVSQIHTKALRRLREILGEMAAGSALPLAA